MKRWLAIACACLALAGCEKPLQFNSVDVTGKDYGPALRLPDAAGEPRSLADFAGKVVVVFFGYTQCPDACPTSLSLMADVTQRLGDEGKRLQTVFITVDPERDTAELVGRYAAAFNPTFVALRGDLEQTRVVAKALNVFYEKRGDVASGRYTVDHTAGLYVFDGKGRARLFVRYGETPERLIEDLKLLLDGR